MRYKNKRKGFLGFLLMIIMLLIIILPICKMHTYKKLTSQNTSYQSILVGSNNKVSLQNMLKYDYKKMYAPKIKIVDNIVIKKIIVTYDKNNLIDSMDVYDINGKKYGMWAPQVQALIAGGAVIQVQLSPGGGWSGIFSKIIQPTKSFLKLTSVEGRVLEIFGNKLKHPQPSFTVTINVKKPPIKPKPTVIDTIDLTNTTITNQKLKFTGKNDHGTFDKNLVSITGLKPKDRSKIGIYAVVFSRGVTNKHKFKGTLEELVNRKILSVGDRIHVYLDLLPKYKTSIYSKKIKLIRKHGSPKLLAVVSNLLVHPSIVGNNTGVDALEKALEIKVLNSTTTTTTINLSSKIGLPLSNGKNWHIILEFFVGSSKAKTISVPNTWFKNGELIVPYHLKNVVPRGITSFNVALVPNVGYKLDGNYTFNVDFSKLNLINVIDTSKLNGLTLHIKGVNGNASVTPKFLSNSSNLSSITNSLTKTLNNFIAPTDTHLVYGIVGSGSKISFIDMNKQVLKWETDPTKLKIHVGQFVVAKLVTNDAKTSKLSNPYFTHFPVKATNLTINMQKVLNPSFLISGFSGSGSLRIKYGAGTENIQVNGINWVVSINGGQFIPINQVKNIINGDKLVAKTVSKPNYIISPGTEKTITTTVSLMKEVVYIKPNVTLSLSIANIGKEKEEGKAKLIGVDILDKISKKKFTIKDIIQGIGIKVVDSKGNIVPNAKLNIYFSINNSKLSTKLPEKLFNGDIVQVFLMLDKNANQSLLKKYKLGQRIFKKLKPYMFTWKVSKLLEKPLNLGKITIKTPKRANGNGTIVIVTEKSLPLNYHWLYKVTTTKLGTKISNWVSKIPTNLKNGDIVEYKITKYNNIGLSKNYYGKVTINGLINTLKLSPQIKKLIDELLVKIKFNGDNGFGYFSKETRNLIEKINNELSKTNSKKIIFKLLTKSSVEIVDKDVHKLWNDNLLSIKIIGKNGTLVLNDDVKIMVKGLRESDESFDKSLTWGLVGGILGSFVVVIIAILIWLKRKRKIK